MSSAKKTILITLSAILLAVALYFAFVFYKQLKEPVSPAIHAIPTDASIIFETKKITEIWDKINSDNDIWKELINIDEINSLNKQLNKIAASISDDSRTSEIIKDKVFCFSFHTDTLLKTNVLFLLGFSNSREAAYIKKYVKSSLPEHYIISAKDFQEAEIITFKSADDKNPFFYSVHKGVFIGSFDELLVNAAIEQLNSNMLITDDKALQKVRYTSGKKVDANIYINFQNFYKTFRNAANSNNQEYLKSLQNIAEWTETDLIIKKDELLLNGFTSVSEIDNNNYLKLFDGQPPQPISLIDRIPFNTIYFLSFSFDDFPAFHTSYKSYLESNSLLKPYIDTINNINTKFNCDVEQSFIPWISNELALIITDPGRDKISSHTYIVLKAKNIDTAAVELNKLSENIYNNTNTTAFAETYNDHLIKQIEIPNIVAALLGKQFEGLESNFYTFYDEYVILANSVAALKQYLNKVKSGKTLVKNENYIEFSDNISEKSNIYMYCNIRKSLNMIKSNSNIDFGNFIMDNNSVFSNFEAFSVQFSSNSELFYTNIYLKYNPFYKEEKSSVWEVNLDAELIGKPHLVRDHTDNSTKIIAFDVNNNLYMIDQNGNIVWKIQLTENIISDVYQIDYYKNAKIQYLFNTKNYLYLVDLNGNMVADYPVKLPAEASNGIAVLDYNKKGDYRILIACNDNRIYNFDIKGSKVKGWRINKTSGKVLMPIKHLYSTKKDYIVSTDENGRINITNRKGINRIKAVKNANNSVNSEVYLNKTNSRGLFLTTDNNGDLIYITNSGGIKTTSFGDFSKGHFFLYEDLDNDDSKDFIFLDKNRLVVFDRFKKIMLNHSFENNIDTKPIFIKLNKNTNILGVIDSKSDKIILFNNKGIIESDIDIIGSTPFVITKKDKSGTSHIISGSGSTIYSYDLLD